MIIPTGEGSVAEYTRKNYVIRQVKPGPAGKEIYLKKPVASVIQIEIVLKKGLGAAMILHDDVETSTFRYPFDDGKTLTLQFDNDCRDRHEKRRVEDANDFDMYYEWLKDMRPFIGGESREFLAGEVISKGMYGNCDPPTVDPPPGP
jgi:hypothetical protein